LKALADLPTVHHHPARSSRYWARQELHPAGWQHGTARVRADRPAAYNLPTKMHWS